MANRAPRLTARGNISPCRFVKLDTGTQFGGVVAESAALPIAGISGESTKYAPLPGVTNTYNAESGDPLTLFGEGEECLLYVNGASPNIIPGDLLIPTTGGAGVKCVLTTSGQQFTGARALQGATADGVKIQVEVVELMVYHA